MFFLQNEFLCRFVILSFTKGFHSQHMSCTILRTHSLCVNGVSDILRVLTSDKVTPNVFTQWSMILLSWLLLHLSTFFKCHLIGSGTDFSQIHTSSSASVPIFWQPWSEEIQQTPEWALYQIPPQTVGPTSNTLNSDPNLTISLGVGKWVPHSNRTKEQEVRKLKVHTEYNGRSLSTLQEMFEIGMVWVS